jgi:hypothetical protein
MIYLIVVIVLLWISGGTVVCEFASDERMSDKALMFIVWPLFGFVILFTNLWDRHISNLWDICIEKYTVWAKKQE